MTHKGTVLHILKTKKKKNPNPKKPTNNWRGEGEERRIAFFFFQLSLFKLVFFH